MLFAYNERKNLYDEIIDSGKNRNELVYSSRKKIDAVHDKMFRSQIFRNAEKVSRAINALKGEDMDFYRKWKGLKIGIDL